MFYEARKFGYQVKQVLSKICVKFIFYELKITEEMFSKNGESNYNCLLRIIICYLKPYNCVLTNDYYQIEKNT